MSVFNTSLNLYRKTVKRIRPLHAAMHWLMHRMAIPVLEHTKGFQTMPDDPFWFRLELLTGRHEPETAHQIERLVQPGMTVLDVGAHVGYYSRRFSALVGDRGRVVAFEPHPRTFGVLSRNVGGLKNVTLAQVAVAEEEGQAELYDYLMMSASGSLHYDEALIDLQRANLTDSDIAPRISRDFPVEKFTVRTVPIDSYLAELGIAQVDFVKMDIEGAEIGALRGMRQTIANSPDLKLIMEYNPQALKAFDLVPEDALNEVVAMGFNSVKIIQPDGTLQPLDDIAGLTAHLMTKMDVVNLLLQ